MPTILLEEQSILKEQQLDKRLEALGYQVNSVSGQALLEQVMNHPYDMILCSQKTYDAVMEDQLRQIRVFSDVPLINLCMNVASDSLGEMKVIFDAIIDPTVDDEMLGEALSDHLRTAYRKCHNVRLYQYKGLKLSNGALKTAEMHQHILDLTVKEHMILSLLLCHRDCIYTKAVLYESVWRQPYQGDDNAIKIHISNLRNKLKKANPEETYIETVRGLGYRLCRK